ncbi:MAG: DUF6252 family protein [Bacteroidota bacterium]
MLRILCSLFLLLALAGCDSGGDDDGGGDLALGSMRAQIDGDGWTATNATATDINVLGTRTLTIAGGQVGDAVSTVTVSITAVDGAEITPGTYAIGDDATDLVFGTGSYSPDATMQQTFLSTSGSVTVDAIDDEGASGTFSFTAALPGSSDTIEVASGQFNVGFGPPIMP